MANWFIADFQLFAARPQSAVMLRRASQISLVAASSFGKCPRVLRILRNLAFTLSMALVATQVSPVAVASEKVPDRQPAEKAPVTLRGLPVASTPNSNGDVIEQMSRLSGQAYQDAFAKLSPQQRRSLVDEE